MTMRFYRLLAAALLAGGTAGMGALYASASSSGNAPDNISSHSVSHHGADMRHHQHHADQSSHGIFRERVRREKLRDPRTKRHDHVFKVRQIDRGSKKTFILKGVTHRHDGYLSHTHRDDDFIHISPDATRWPVPRSTRGMLDNLPLPIEVIQTAANPLPDAITGDPSPARLAPDRLAPVLMAPVLLAHVVFRQENGVTVIRNANTVISPGLPIVDDNLIGNTGLPVPRTFFSVEELEFCNRRVRTLSSPSGKSIRIDEARFCE